MKIRNLFFWLGLAIGCGSCETGEKLEPRTNPRFSVALIQEISEEGVQFAANVYDFGSEQIEEYGFVYSKSSGVANINLDDFVSAKGKPDRSFTLTANHSMQVNSRYFVSAYLKTSERIVYSEAKEFVSQGSTGFVITEVEWPEKLYKDQLLTIKGSRLSRVTSNYRVNLDIYPVQVSLIDSNTFVVNIPDQLTRATTGSEKEIELKIAIAGKEYSQRKVVQFEQAEIEELPVQHIDHDEEVKVQGYFLDQSAISLAYNSANLSNIQALSSREFSFFPYRNLVFNEGDQASPEVTMTMRGIAYPLGKIFELNPSRVETTEMVLDDFREVLYGENFSTQNVASVNQLVTPDGRSVSLGQTEFYRDSIVFYPKDIFWEGREYRVRVKNFGKFSTYFTVKVNYPEIFLNYGEGVDTGYRKATTQQGDVGYTVYSDGVLKHHLSGELKSEKISNLPAGYREGNMGLFSSTENFLIIGGGKDSGLEKGDFYIYDIAQGTWKKLPTIPGENDGFQSVYEAQGGLIFEQGFRIDYMGEGTIFNRQAWFYSFADNGWTRLPDSVIERSVQTFSGENKLVCLAYMGETGEMGIYTKSLPYDSWKLVKVTEQYLGYYLLGNPPIIDGKAYLLSSNTNIKELDLSTFEMKDLGIELYEVIQNVAFSRGKSILILGQFSAKDIRPDLIRD